MEVGHPSANPRPAGRPIAADGRGRGATLRLVRSPPRQILLPGLAFVLLLVLALAAVQHARSTPKGALVLTLQAYVAAVRSGDVGTARALAPGFEVSVLDAHVEGLEGLAGHVARVTVSSDGRAGEAEVTWVDPRGRGRQVELLDWRRARTGDWRLERVRRIR